MSKVNIVWMPDPECPEAFWISLKACSTVEDALLVMCDAHERGWITIFGQTQKNTEQIAEMLRENDINAEVLDGDDRRPTDE